MTHDAMQRYADSVRGSVKNFATDADEATQRIVMRMIGTDDDRIGASLLTPMRTVARSLNAPGVVADILNRIDNAGKATFGQPPGLLREYQRHLRNGLLPGAREAYTSTEATVRQGVVSAMRDAGLNAGDLNEYQKAHQVLLAHMFDLRNKSAIDDAADGVFYTTKFDSDEPADWVQLLSKAQEDGYFASPLKENLSDKLRTLAQSNLGALDKMGAYEQADQLLKMPLDGYIPAIPTPAAVTEIGKTANQRIAEKMGTAAAQKGALQKEAFQKPKTTWQYRWESPTGGQKRFFEKDRWVQDFPDELVKEVAKDDAESAANIYRLKEDIAEYEGLAKDKKWAAAHAAKQTDPWELNELHRDGDFRLLTGSEPLPDGFMDLNPATIMAARTMAHEKAVARRSWLEFTKQFGVAVDPYKVQGKRQEGLALTLKDGSVAKFYQTHDGTWGLEQLGQRFRPLKQSVQDLKDNPLIEGMGKTRAMLYHEDVARAIEDAASHFGPEDTGLLRLLDTATAAFKTATLVHPSWTVGNFVGDTINQLTNGAQVAHMTKHAPALAKILANANDPEALKALSVTVRGQTITGEQLLNDLRDAGLIGSNMFGETVLQLNARKHFVLPSLVGGAEARGLKDQFRPSVLSADFKERLSHEMAAKRTFAKGRAAGFVARDRFVRNFLRPWFKFNERANDYIKGLAYLSFLEQGNDIQQAVRRTIRAGFAYEDNTRVERDWFKRMLPFYSFQRLNGAYQIKTLLNRPIYAGSFPLLQNAIEEAIDGDAAIPLHARPNWMRQQLAIQIGSDPNERFALLLGNLLPQEQGFAALSAARGVLAADQAALQDTAKYLVGSINPVLRAPLEIGAGKEFFGDRTIGLDGDITPAQHLVNQVRPLREIPKLAQAFGEQGIGAGVARGLLGGRVQPMSDDRIRLSRLREFKDKEQRLHTSLRRAEREGNVSKRSESNLSLLLLYKRMVEAGLESDVPKWAQKRLAALAAPG
jgi:hypothetical protein